MGAKIIRLPQVAARTIEQVLAEFLAEQRERLQTKTQKKYDDVIYLLRCHLNSYAYEGLSKAEAAVFEQYFNAEGEDHREFCQLFGPEKIIENLSSFLGFFMIRKVSAGEDLKRTAGTVTKKLSHWLAAKEYIAEEAGLVGTEAGAEAARNLPRAERAAQLLLEAVDALAVAPAYLDDEDYLEFDHYPIAKVEPGKLWLKIFEGGGEKTLGPIPVPKKATELLQRGWDISCALGRIHGQWRIIEVANVYPHSRTLYG
jgi:hypothetical protein